MGSIETRTRKDGTRAYRWKARLDGRQGPQVSETFSTHKAAEEFDAMVAKHGYPPPGWEQGKFEPSTMPTVLESVTELIRNNVDIQPRTRADYERIARRYIEPTVLGSTPIDRVDKDRVRTWLRQLQSEKLSNKTISGPHSLVSAAFAAEVERGRIPRNPAVGLAPKIRKRPPLKVSTREEARALLKTFPEDNQLFVMTLFETGMRWQEISALQWRHLRNASIDIRQAWAEGSSRGKMEMAPTKSDAGIRTLYISDGLSALLEEKRGKPDEWIFKAPAGGHLRYGDFHTRIWRPTVIAAYDAGIIHIKPTIHDARHMFASWVLADGTVNIYALSKMLGHSDPAVVTSPVVVGFRA